VLNTDKASLPRELPTKRSPYVCTCVVYKNKRYRNVTICKKRKYSMVPYMYICICTKYFVYSS
jgi:hypothetical protein